MHRLYVDATITDSAVIDDLDQVRQITKVLRLGKGDRILIFNGDGNEHICEITARTQRSLRLTVLKTKEGIGFTRDIVLYQALLKRDNLQLVVQKATELGIKKIVPVLTDHCVKDSLNDKQLERLRLISKEATEQSEGALLAEIGEPVSLDIALDRLDGSALHLFAYAREEGNPIDGLDLSNEISVFVGPEGGFSARELELAHEKQLTVVSLGERIYRAETAAIALLGRLVIR